MAELTEDEKGLVGTAILHACFPPKPVPARVPPPLRARVVDLKIIDELVTFALSERGVLAFELGVPLGEAKGSMN